MNAFRRADAGHSRPGASATGAIIVALSAALIATLGVWTAAVFSLARRVVKTPSYPPNTHVLAVNTRAQTVTLSRTTETALPGRYGLETTGTIPYLRLGSIHASDERTVTRKLLTQVDPSTRIAREARFGGWYFTAPEDLHVPFTDVVIDGPVGPLPAWVFPGETDSGTWVIQIHGRGTTRAECLRRFPSSGRSE